MDQTTLTIGIGLSSEEHGPTTLVEHARAALELGFDDFAVTDHFHPWIDAQGHSPFVWSVLGALSQLDGVRLGTAVTCPTMRIHPAVIAQARKVGIPDKWMEAARKSPVYKMAVDWKVALPLHPEYRTLPMVWYVPPLSPISSAANAGHLGVNGQIPDVNQLRIPVKYLANLLTAGDTAPIVRALERMLGMRAYQRAKHVERRVDMDVLNQVGLSQAEAEDMYQTMAIANYEDRFVIPTTHREYAENAFNVRGGCGFTFGNGCSDGVSNVSLFGQEKKRTIPIKAEV